MEIEFISYTGRFPNLCSGELILEIDGKPEIFGVDALSYSGKSWKEIQELTKNHHPRFWSSGGTIRSTSDYSDMWAEHGPWEIDVDDLPDYLKPYSKEIIRVFNENVQWGCCGGCI